MPAGVAASLLLLRLLATTRGDITGVPLPGLAVEWRVLAAVLALLALGAGAWRARRLPLRGATVVAGFIAALAAYGSIHWAHLLLVAALLSVLSSARVSLAPPAPW